MYYYITEPPRSSQQQRLHERVRELLTNLGILGEVVVTSPARTAEELAELGAAKKYSTIVAVGGDQLINQVGTLLAGTPYVFGALPIYHPEALELVTGITTVDEAALALKHRRLRIVPIARIEPNKFFLTELNLRSPSPLPLRLQIDEALVEAEVTDLRIGGSGRLILANRYAAGAGPLVRLMELFGASRPLDPRYLSDLHGQRIVLETEGTLPVYLGSTVLAKTPLAIEVISNSLKMIGRRDKVAPSQVTIGRQ